MISYDTVVKDSKTRFATDRIPRKLDRTHDKCYGQCANGFDFSIHFNRHGDCAASVCQLLLKQLGYGTENTLRGELSGLVMMD
jgi:hypothetical protein